MKLILVTGASGFIGSNLILHLLKSTQSRIRAFMLPSDPLRHPENGNPILASNRLEIFLGDIRNKNDVSKAVSGASHVFHLAALSHLGTKRRKDHEEINIKGTQHVCDACLKHHVEGLVHTSSSEVLKRTNQNPTASENHLLEESNAPGPYTRSKIAEEKIVLEYAQKRHAVIVNPTMPVGPGDFLPSPVGFLIQMILQKKMGRFYYPTGFNLVDVRSLAKGHLQAMQDGLRGHRYILGGPNLSFEIFYKKVAANSHQARLGFKIPYGLACLTSGLMENLALFTGNTPLGTLEGIRSVRIPFYMDTTKAKNELGFSCHSIDEALKIQVKQYTVGALLAAP